MAIHLKGAISITEWRTLPKFERDVIVAAVSDYVERYNAALGAK